jgi:hypothetical protein
MMVAPDKERLKEILKEASLLTDGLFLKFLLIFMRQAAILQQFRS